MTVHHAAPRADTHPQRTDPHHCRSHEFDEVLGTHNHLLHALREFEDFYNTHRPHRSLNGAPLRPAPEPLTELSRLDQLDILRRDRLGGLLREYQHAA
jgi:transposase InsO family protein